MSITAKPYISTLPRFALQAVDQAFPWANLILLSGSCNAGTLPAAASRSAHTVIPFSPLQGRGPPRIYSRFFFIPHPHHTKQQITRQDHAARFTVLSGQILDDGRLFHPLPPVRNPCRPTLPRHAAWIIPPVSTHNSHPAPAAPA